MQVYLEVSKSETEKKQKLPALFSIFFASNKTLNSLPISGEATLVYTS